MCNFPVKTVPISISSTTKSTRQSRPSALLRKALFPRSSPHLKTAFYYHAETVKKEIDSRPHSVLWRSHLITPHRLIIAVHPGIVFDQGRNDTEQHPRIVYSAFERDVMAPDRLYRRHRNGKPVREGAGGRLFIDWTSPIKYIGSGSGT